MKLSEAIRLGSMLKPQAFHVERGVAKVSGWRGWLLGRTQQTSCAFAAALDAQPCGTAPFLAEECKPLRGFSVSDGLTAEALVIPDEWQVLFLHAPCPICSEKQSVFSLIAHLNDFHRWTRECIAAFVAEMEEYVEAKVTVEIAVPVPIRARAEV